MKRANGRYWFSALAAWITLAVVVPYTFLAGYPGFAGACLYWLVFGVVAIAIVLHMLRGWRV